MKKTCEICGGTGQVGSFRGESRFMITWEECSECLGIGHIDDDRTETPSGKPERGGDDHPDSVQERPDK